jgi:hypothetical protein
MARAHSPAGSRGRLEETPTWMHGEGQKLQMLPGRDGWRQAESKDLSRAQIHLGLRRPGLLVRTEAPDTRPGCQQKTATVSWVLALCTTLPMALLVGPTGLNYIQPPQVGPTVPFYRGGN